MNKTLVMIATAVSGVLAFGAAAGATPADPTDGAAGDIQTQTTGWVTSQGIPMIVGLLVLGIVVALLVKFAKRGAKSA